MSAGSSHDDRIGISGLDCYLIVAPGHCTGWRAAAALADAFSPAGFAPSVVGTRYPLTAR